MRYGLISNLWRNWGPVGERVSIPKQMEYEWGYLWAEIDVLAGELNVWLLPEMNGATLSRIVTKMPEKWGNNVALVWDNAGAHKSAAKRLPAGMSAISLPAYSPELNPVERFFQELRRKIANKIFSSLEELEDALVKNWRSISRTKRKSRDYVHIPGSLSKFREQDNLSLFIQIGIMLHNGLRNSEVTGIRWGDFREERSYMILNIRGKGGKESITKIKPKVMAAIEDYVQASGRELDRDSPLFVGEMTNSVIHWNRIGKPLSTGGIRYMVKKYAKMAGIDKRISPHSLRHTCVTLCLDGGGTVRHAANLARHEDIRITMRYNRSMRNLDDHGTDYISLNA